ncbi:N-acetyl-D-Glu racemase DgcA [Vibrio hippocampi]|uniref:Dipeptide epimerase n=1 Tax=Vibrio hippocampi TaxID=654686 RepID=A0ABM8ZKI7_9VIBR|nr:N-acetyl-D-Glu racemase DgcA [Vibrio hippocampi]CAH0528767.1 L-Ala-D/L-Glu epimerase [Vibrio hippocampi]
MELTISQGQYPINGSFTISRGSKTSVETVIVTLQKQGVVGRGECVPYPRYDESVDSVSAQIQSISSEINAGIDRQTLQSLLPSGAARNAIDNALWDLECKLARTSIWHKLDLSAKPLQTAFTISLAEPSKMEQDARDNAFRPLLKLKLGGADDLQRVAAVRRGAPNADIIVDANEAWSVELYQQLVPHLVELGVSMIEQPFPAGEDHILADLPRPITICADESCHDRHSLDQIASCYDMINIKIDKTGGLTEALLLKRQAQDLGLKVMVGCMLSSSLSMAPAFVLAQDADIVDLDGPLLLAQDIDNGFDFTDNLMLPFSSKLWG